MELLYVWISEYKNIKQQGFNFSVKHDIQFDYRGLARDHTSILHIKKRQVFTNDLWNPNITNLTAIVGINGAGKSSVLRFLLYKELKSPAVIIWLNRKKEIQVFYSDNFIKIESSEESELYDVSIQPSPSIQDIL